MKDSLVGLLGEGAAYPRFRVRQSTTTFGDAASAARGAARTGHSVPRRISCTIGFAHCPQIHFGGQSPRRQASSSAIGRAARIALGQNHPVESVLLEGAVNKEGMNA